MEYYKKIAISKEKAKLINTYLTVEPSCEEECFSEDETITETVRFDNGYEMDIKCCGVQYHENECNTAWTEAVLFNKRGGSVSCSEPEETFLGKWTLSDYQGNTYTTEVVQKN